MVELEVAVPTFCCEYFWARLKTLARRCEVSDLGRPCGLEALNPKTEVLRTV